jgi:hypothetical protein
MKPDHPGTTCAGLDADPEIDAFLAGGDQTVDGLTLWPLTLGKPGENQLPVRVAVCLHYFCSVN